MTLMMLILRYIEKPNCTNESKIKDYYITFYKPVQTYKFLILSFCHSYYFIQKKSLLKVVAELMFYKNFREILTANFDKADFAYILYFSESL